MQSLESPRQIRGKAIYEANNQIKRLGSQAYWVKSQNGNGDCARAQKRRNKVGRKAVITEDNYIKAVRRIKSTKDSGIGKFIGVSRQAVYNFRKNNPSIFEKALSVINEMESMRFDSKYVSIEIFKQIPTILNWKERQIAKKVKPLTINDRIRTIYNVCKYLKVHPDNMSLEQCAKLVIMMRDVPKEKRGRNTEYHGVAYYTIRKPLRSFFQLVRGISGELLTSVGIDSSRTEGTGSAASEKVTEEQRGLFEDTLRNTIKEFDDVLVKKNIDDEIMFREILGAAHFMYYTGTRIGGTNPTEAGTLSIMANNPKHIFNKNLLSINVMDKGKRNRYIEWDKLLMDDGIKRFRDYVTNRFDIQNKDLNKEMSNLNTPLFPTIQKNYRLETEIMKATHKRTGCITKYPNHIWRHTFAQDCLSATDWNYELVASLGGWISTETLKLSYREMNKDAKERGLRKAMGLPVEDVTYELKW